MDLGRQLDADGWPIALPANLVARSPVPIPEPAVPEAGTLFTITLEGLSLLGTHASDVYEQELRARDISGLDEIADLSDD